MSESNQHQLKLTESALLGITRSPGAQYILINSDEVLLECNAGIADVLTKSPVKSENTFNCFSITKTATAAAIMQLSEQKKISLTDYVNPMFNEFHFEYPFTIEQLVTHQAGLPDPIPISWIHLASEDTTFNESDFIRKVVDKHSKQKYKPGTKFSYSSIGYLLLSLIIEKVSGESYSSYVSKNILSPAAKDLLNYSTSLEFFLKTISAINFVFEFEGSTLCRICNPALNNCGFLIHFQKSLSLFFS